MKRGGASATGAVSTVGGASGRDLPRRRAAGRAGAGTRRVGVGKRGGAGRAGI